MRRWLLAIMVLGLASFAAQDASAEACLKSTGVTRWTAVGTVTGSAWEDGGGGCTAGAGDDFEIDGGNVEIAGDIALTTGSVTCNSGTLRIGPGAGITAAGGSARAVLTIAGTCNFIADGGVVWSGRIGSTAITYAAGPPKTATFTVQGGSVTAATAAATTDYIVFGDDDPASATATITSPVQIGSGAPEVGKYRPTYPKWTWWDINAVAAGTVTINTDAYTVESLPTGAGTTPFTGTRGPGLITSTAITSMARTPHGFMTAITLEVGAIADGDMGAQYVTVTTGACANRTYKIAYVDAAVGDVIYVYGDLTETCGATPEIVINYGWRNGDPIKVIRPAYIDGGKIGRVDWTGGTINANYLRLVKLFPSTPTTTEYACLFCIRRESASIAPDFDSSRITNLDLAFPGMVTAGTATGAVTFDNLNAAANDYAFGTSQLDASGLVFDRVYIHDQDLESTSGNEGVHGLLYTSATGLTATRWRIARLGDDGVFVGHNVWSNTSHSQAATLRQFQVDEGMSLSNSQQLLDASYPSPGGNESSYSLTVSDYGGNCCTDGPFQSNVPNMTLDRIVSSGTNGIPGGLNIGVNSAGYTSSAPIVGATNVIRDSIAMLLGPTADTNHLKLAASVSNSIIAGNVTPGNVSNQFVQAPYAIRRSFIDMGSANVEGYFRRVPLLLPALSTPMIYLEDAALLNGNTGINVLLNDANNGTGGAGNPSMEDTGTGIVMSSYDITRTFFGNRVPSGGLCDLNCNTADGIAGGRTLTADGITIAMTTTSAGGVGMGAANEGTLEGARITNACVQTSGLPSGDNVFGAAYTATSLTTVGAYPRPEMDVPLRNFVRQPGDSTICGSAARPRTLGLKKFGTAHAMLGDGVAGNIELFTTDDRLIRQFGGGGGGGGGACIGTDCASHIGGN